MLRSCSWALWLLVPALLAGHAAAQTQTEPPWAFRRVLIPPDRAESLLQQEKETLHPVPPQQFERLLSLVQNARVLDQESVRTRIIRCEHVVEYLPPHTLQGTTRLRIDHRAEHPVLLPLVPWKVALREAHWVQSQEDRPSRPVVLGVGSQGRVLLLVEHGGEVELRWQLRAARHTPRGGRFSLELPLVPGQSLEVQAPAETSLRVSPAGLVETIKGPEGSGEASPPVRWLVRPPAVSPLVLHFQKRRASSGVVAGYRQHNQVQLAPQGLQMVTTVVFQGAVPKSPLQFQVPEALEVLQVELADKAIPFRRAGPGILQLDTEEPILPGQAVRLRAAGAWSLDRQQRLPQIRPRGAVWQAEQTRLELLPPLVLKHWLLRHGRQTSTWNGQTTTVQHFGPEGTIELVVGQAEPRRQIRQGTVVEIAPGTLTARTVFQVRPLNGELFHLEAMLERGWTLDRVETEPADLLRHWHLESAPQGRRRLHLELGRALSSGQTGVFRLELHQRMIDHRRSIPLDWLWPVAFPEDRYPVSRWLSLRWADGPPPQVQSPVLQRPLPESEKRQVYRLLPELPQQAVVWRLPPGKLSGHVLLSQGKTQFQVAVQQRLHLRRQQWTLDAQLRIEPLAGEVDRLELVVSPWADPPRVSWPQGEAPPRLEEEDSQRAAVAPARRFQLVFPRPVRSATTVQLRWQGRWSGKEPLHVPLLGVANAEAAQGNVAVLTQQWFPLAWKTSSLIASSGETGSQPSSPWRLLAAWGYDPQRLAEQPELFLLALNREDNPALLRPVVWQYRVDTFWDARSQVLEHRCRLLLDHPASGRLGFAIPRGLEVTALSIQGRPRQWHLEGRRLHVQVPRASSPGQVLMLEFWLRGQWHPGGFWGRLAPPRLQAEYPFLAGRWYLWSGEQLRRPGPSAATLWQRWFGPLAGELPPLEASSEGISGPPAFSPVEDRLRQARRAFAAQLQATTNPPGDWGTLLLRAGQVLARQGSPLLLDSHGLAQVGLTPRSPLRPDPTAPAVSFADLLQRHHLKLKAAGKYLVLTTSEAESFSPAEGGADRGEPLPAHWVSPAQWLWRYGHSQAAVPSLLAESPQRDSPWQRVAVVEFLPGKELPQLHLAWAPWWHLAGWLVGLVVAVAVAWGGKRFPRTTAAAAGFGLWVAAVVPLPWLLLTQRAVWGLWMGAAALALAPRREDCQQRTGGRVPVAAGAAAILALLLSDGWHASLRAQPAGGKVYSVYIPEEKQPEYYFVPEEFYRFLVEQADRLSRKPRGWLLQRASYRVTLPAADQRQARVLAFYYVRVFGTQEPIQLDFSRLSEQLRPETVGVNGMQVPARWDAQGRLVIEVPEPGTYELELSLHPPVERDGLHSRFRLPVPSAISARLEVLAGDEPVLLLAEPCLGSVQAQARGELWQGELGPVAQLGLRWQPWRQERLERLEADQLLWLRIHPGSVVLETQLHCRPLDSPLRGVEVWVDPSLQLIPPESPLVEHFQWLPLDSESPPDDAPAPGMRLLKLTFREPAAGPVEVPLAFVMKDASGVGRWGVPLVQLRHTESLQFWLAVSVDRTLHYRELGRQELEPLEAEAFVALWNQVEELPAVSYDCGGRYPVRYAVFTRPAMQPPRVESLQSWALYPGYAEVVFEAQVDQLQQAALFHQVRVPRDVHVLEVQLGHQQRWRPVRWGRWAQHVVLWLPEALPSLRLRLRGWMRLPDRGMWNVPQLDLAPAASAKQSIRIYHHGTLLLSPLGREPQQASPPDPARADLLPAGQWSVAAGEPRPRVLIEPNRPRVTGQLDCAVVPGRQGRPWRIDCQLNLHVQQGALPRVKLLARHLEPKDVRLLTPGRLETWTFPGQEKLLVYVPPQPLRDRVQLRLEILWRPQPERDEPLPQLVPLEMRELQTYLLIPDPDADSPWQWRSRRLTPLALQGRPLAPVPRPRALRALGPRWQLVLQPRQSPRRPLRLLLVQHRLAVTQSGPVIQRSRLLLSAPREGDCHFLLPPGAEVVAVRWGEQPALWHLRADRTLQVQIPASTLPRVLHLVAQLAPLELPRHEQARTHTLQVVEPLGIRPERKLWSVVVPWTFRASLQGGESVSDAEVHRRWLQELAARVTQAPPLDRGVLQRWWDETSQALQLFPLPPELEAAGSVDPAWKNVLDAQHDLQRALHRRRLRWSPPAHALPVPERGMEFHAEAQQAPQLVLRARRRVPLAGLPWWVWVLAPLGTALAAAAAPRLALLWRRWSSWALVLVGLVWLVGLSPPAVALALIAAGVLRAWRSPP